MDAPLIPIVISERCRSERLRKAIENYCVLLQDVVKRYGHTEMMPRIIEEGITHDVQLLELFEAARAEYVAAEKE